MYNTPGLFIWPVSVVTFGLAMFPNVSLGESCEFWGLAAARHFTGQTPFLMCNHRQ